MLLLKRRPVTDFEEWEVMNVKLHNNVGRKMLFQIRHLVMEKAAEAEFLGSFKLKAQLLNVQN